MVKLLYDIALTVLSGIIIICLYFLSDIDNMAVYNLLVEISTVLLVAFSVILLYGIFDIFLRMVAKCIKNRGW